LAAGATPFVISSDRKSIAYAATAAPAGLYVVSTQ
jgi:hypothetical protein